MKTALKAVFFTKKVIFLDFLFVFLNLYFIFVNKIRTKRIFNLLIFWNYE